MEQPAHYVFDDGVVRIGRGIVSSNDETYFVYAINCSRIEVSGRKITRFIGFIIAVLAIYSGISQNEISSSAIFFAISIAMCFFAKEKYILLLSTVAGERRLLWSMDKKYLGNVRRCIEQCLVGARQSQLVQQKLTDTTPISAKAFFDDSSCSTPQSDRAPSRVAAALIPIGEGRSLPASPRGIVPERTLTKSGLLWFFSKVALLFDFVLFAVVFAFVARAEVERQTGRNIFSDLEVYLSTARTGPAIDNKTLEPAEVP